MTSFMEFAFYFLAYAFLGWCTEVAFAAMKAGRFVNRGFLNGPYCPIYGFGASLVILALTPLQHNLPALFFGSMLITTLLEYLTGAVLEWLFHTRWWDYNDMPFNIHGHVCLLFSVLWGLACTFVMRIIHPLISALYGVIAFPVMIVILCIAGSMMLADTIATIAAVRKMSRRLQRIDELAKELRKLSDELGENIFEHASDAKDWWEASIQPKLAELEEHNERIRADYREKLEDVNEAIADRRAQYRERLDQLSQALSRSAIERRMINAYPRLKAMRYPQALEHLKKYDARIRRKNNRKTEDKQ